MNSRDEIFAEKFSQTEEFIPKSLRQRHSRKGYHCHIFLKHYGYGPFITDMSHYGYGPYNLAEGLVYSIRVKYLKSSTWSSAQSERFKKRLDFELSRRDFFSEILFCDFNSGQNRENRPNECTPVNKVSSQYTSVTHCQLRLSSPTLPALDRPLWYPPPSKLYKRKK